MTTAVSGSDLCPFPDSCPNLQIRLHTLPRGGHQVRIKFDFSRGDKHHYARPPETEEAFFLPALYGPRLVSLDDGAYGEGTDLDDGNQSPSPSLQPCYDALVFERWRAGTQGNGVHGVQGSIHRHAWRCDTVLREVKSVIVGRGKAEHHHRRSGILSSKLRVAHKCRYTQITPLHLQERSVAGRRIHQHASIAGRDEVRRVSIDGPGTQLQTADKEIVEAAISIERELRLGSVDSERADKCRNFATARRTPLQPSVDGTGKRPGKKEVQCQATGSSPVKPVEGLLPKHSLCDCFTGDAVAKLSELHHGTFVRASRCEKISVSHMLM